MKLRLDRRLALVSVLLAPWLSATAQTYPAKPIHVIVPYAPGGVVDVQARIVLNRMQAELGQPIVVEAKPGASGNIAAQFVARSPADGYTLLVSAPFLINNPLLEDSLRWAPADFTPVARFALSPSYFVVPASSPARSVADYVEMARKAPKPLQYGDGGTGSTQSMANEMFAQAARIPLESVAYKGAPPMVPDLINGAFSMAVLPSTVAAPHLKSGALRALANISSSRSPQFPDVPTIAEAGYPQATALSWYAFHAPAGTPAEVLRRLEQAVRTATASDEVKDRLATAGGESAFLGRDDFQTFLKADAQRWEKMVKAVRK